MKERLTPEKILKITVWVVAITAITMLGTSQFTIRISRLSTAEQTGISLFAFMIFGLVTVFAVSRINGLFSRVFAVIMNGASAFCAVWYLRMLFTDPVFLQGLYFVMDPRTRILQPLSTSARIIATLPLVAIAVGALVYLLAALTIAAVSFAALRSGGTIRKSTDD